VLDICERQLKLEGKDTLDSGVAVGWMPVIWKRAQIDSKRSEEGLPRKRNPILPICSKLLNGSPPQNGKPSMPIVTKRGKGVAAKKSKKPCRKVISSSSEDESESTDSIYQQFTSSASSSDSDEDERVIKKAKNIGKKFFKH
jgi:hypothetical protein